MIILRAFSPGLLLTLQRAVKRKLKIKKVKDGEHDRPTGGLAVEDWLIDSTIQGYFFFLAYSYKSLLSMSKI